MSDNKFKNLEVKIMGKTIKGINTFTHSTSSKQKRIFRTIKKFPFAS